jgi:hypothetical protein
VAGGYGTSRGGMQSLGKVSTVRRAPKPVDLPSLRAESTGLDTNAALVTPAGAVGWGSRATSLAHGAVADPAPTTSPAEASPAEAEDSNAGQSKAPRTWAKPAAAPAVIDVPPVKAARLDAAFPQLGSSPEPVRAGMCHRRGGMCMCVCVCAHGVFVLLLKRSPGAREQPAQVEQAAAWNGGQPAIRPMATPAARQAHDQCCDQ